MDCEALGHVNASRRRLLWRPLGTVEVFVKNGRTPATRDGGVVLAVRPEFNVLGISKLPERGDLLHQLLHVSLRIGMQSVLRDSGKNRRVGELAFDCELFEERLGSGFPNGSA